LIGRLLGHLIAPLAAGILIYTEHESLGRVYVAEEELRNDELRY
jgi:hypothetical protein